MLQALERRYQRSFKRWKGTVFDNGETLFIGRVCADADYLGRFAHWANVSLEQLDEVAAASPDKRVVFLFITARLTEGRIDFWQVPADLVRAYVYEKQQVWRGGSSALHIRERRGRFWMGSYDVTEFHDSIELATTTEEVMEQRLEQGPATESVGAKGRSSSPDRLEPPPEPAGYNGVFEVPTSLGHPVVLSVPYGINRADLARVKSFVDLIADLVGAGKGE